MAFIDIEQGWPSMYAVDLAIPVFASQINTLVEGMCIHNDDGEWKIGCPVGFMPYITAPAQSPTALDVSRVINATFEGFPGGYGEMGGGAMGGVCLNNPLRFVTDQFDGLTGGEVVWGATDGLFKAATLATHQVAGVCEAIITDEYGRSLAQILSGPVLQRPA